jgi:hypothetical protein
MERSLLRDCNACGKEVSRHSPFCRNCGHPQGSPLIITLLVLFVILTLAFYVGFMIYAACHIDEFQKRESSQTSFEAPAAGVSALLTTDGRPTARGG